MSTTGPGYDPQGPGYDQPGGGMGTTGAAGGMTTPGTPGGGYGYGPGPGMGMGRYGRGFGGGQRRDHPIETKPFFLTSEFAVGVIAVIALAITAMTDDSIDARMFWILTTILTSFYMLSRGIAKSGTKSRSFDPREEMRIGEGSGGQRG